MVTLGWVVIGVMAYFWLACLIGRFLHYSSCTGGNCYCRAGYGSKRRGVILNAKEQQG